MSREKSPADRAKRNGWVVGTVLKLTELDLGQPCHTYWRITAIGEYEILGIRVYLPEYTTSGESVIPFNRADSWKKVRRSAEFSRKIGLLEGNTRRGPRQGS